VAMTANMTSILFVMIGFSFVFCEMVLLLQLNGLVGTPF